ncbi:hypothetical protein D3C83_18610 [compost metagenome]
MFMSAVSSAPVFSPTRSMRMTSGGNTPRLRKVSVRLSPAAICWPARTRLSEMTRLFTTSSQVLIASSTVMPERYMSAKMFAKRDRMIFCSVEPTSGRRSFA